MFPNLDFKTMVVCHVGMAGFVGLVLLFCRACQKTYPGFDFWVAGSLTAVAGYLTVMVGSESNELFRILVGNSLFALAALLRLEATFRFLRGKKMTRKAYLLVPVVTAGVAWFYFIHPNISLRNLVLSLVVGGVTTRIAWEFFRHAGTWKPALFRAIAFMMAIFSGMILLRALAWCLRPDMGLYDAAAFQAPYVFATILSEMGNGMAFLLLNSQRLEEELVNSQKDLASRLAEIKVLRGMLPICASCKSIHDGHGHWEHIESYVQRNSEAEFSHSICPECVLKLYPEYARELADDGAAASRKDASNVLPR